MAPKARNGGGGGRGAGAGANNGRRNAAADDEGDEGDDEGTLDDDTRGEISRVVAATVTSMLGRKLGPAIEGIVGKRFTKLEGLLEGLGRRTAGDDVDEDDEEEEEEERPARGRRQERAAAPAKGKSGKSKADPEVVKLRETVAKIEADRAREVQEGRAAKRDGALRELASKAGVEPNRIRGAVAILREQTKIDEETGEAYYLTKRNDIEEEVDLAAGVKEWVATDEGKSFLAAPQGARGGAGTRTAATRSTSAGSGAASAIGRGAGRNQPDPKAAKAERVAAATARLSEQVHSLLGSGNVDLG